jgi:hypothetical protein
MANVLLNLEKGIEVAAEDALKFLTGAEATATKLEPAVVSGLGVLLGAVSTGLSDVSSAASASGLNIALDIQTATALKAIWPAIETFATSIGIKF